jgi:enoyl-CoA hydratase/carnithine racemase
MSHLNPLPDPLLHAELAQYFQSLDGTGRVEWRLDEEWPSVAWVRLSNPGKLNAVSVSMWLQLQKLFQELAARGPYELRCIVLEGASPAFAAGGDIEEFPMFRFDPVKLRYFHEHVVNPALQRMLACDIPVVASIQGACVGGGLELAACCDIRIASDDARFGAPIAKLGFPMAIDELAVVSSVVGQSLAAEMLLEGRLYAAREAEAKGIVHRVVANEVLQAEVRHSVQRIIEGAPLAARANKRALRDMRLARRVAEQERQALYAYADSHDHREGLDAFLAKRKPAFIGR